MLYRAYNYIDDNDMLEFDVVTFIKMYRLFQ